MSGYKTPNERLNERYQRQAARARTSGPMALRCAVKAPMRALAKLQAEKLGPVPWSRKPAPPPIGTTCAWCVALHSGTPRAALGPHPGRA